MSEIAIVGGGLSALRTAESLRQQGYADGIVVIGDESSKPYNRPPLSKEVLRGAATTDSLEFGVSDQLTDARWLLGHAVQGANLDSRELVLDDGSTIGFTGLVAATGVTSRRLHLPGPVEGRVVLRNLADAISLKARLTPGTNLVVLGAGFIGCEVARTAVNLGCTVDVVTIDSSPMKVPLGAEVGGEILRRHEQAGVRFHLGTSVVETLGDRKVEQVRLTDGTVLRADLMLETVGSQPNVAWLEGNGLDLSNGVLTDPYLRAGGRDRAVAVGDLARFENPMFASPAMRVEHWQTAVDTARFAAVTLLADLGIGGQEPRRVSILPWFWSDQGDLQLTSYGMLGLADSIEILEGDLDGECAVSYLRDGEPVGVLLIGLKAKAARYKRWLVQARAGVTA